MTYRFLQIFMTVVECGKMSEAAKRLYITQSSVSQSIAAVEKEYGVLLFERLAHGLYLTPEGEELLAYARKIVAAKNDMEEFLSSNRMARKLRVGATVTVGTCVISPILKAVRELLPKVDMSVYISNTHAIERKLLDNSLDVALVEGVVQSPELSFKNIIKDTLVLVCPRGHHFYGRAFVQASELADEPLILREPGSGTRASFESQMTRLGQPIKVRWECSTSEAIKNAVKNGHGLSIISERLVREEVASGEFWACGISDLDLARYFAIVYHKNKYLSEGIQGFIDQCEAFALMEKTQ